MAPTSPAMQERLGLEKLRKLSQEERHHLSKGNQIALYVGKAYCGRIAIRLFKALSSNPSAIIVLSPQQRELRMPQGFNLEPFDYLHEWLRTVTTAKDFHLPKSRGSLDKDIAVCRAARLLGMFEYVQHIFDDSWVKIHQNVPSYETLTEMEKLAIEEEENDLVDCDGCAFFNAITTRLGTLVCNLEIVDTTSMSAYLQEHPRMMDAVAGVVSRIMSQASGTIPYPDMAKTSKPDDGNSIGNRMQDSGVADNVGANLALLHTRALLRQNMLYRMEHYKASVDPTFTFSNPAWAYFEDRK